jgi:MscS family membrane protein
MNTAVLWQAIWAGAMSAPPVSQPATNAPWYDMECAGNTIWQWLGLLAVILASFVVGRIIAFFMEKQAKRFEEGERLRLLGMLLRCMAGPAKLLVLAGGLYFASTFMDLNGAAGLYTFWIQACKTLAALAAGWLIYRLVDIIEFFLLHWTSKTETQLDDQLVPLVRKSLRVFVVIVAALFIAQNVFRWNIGALVAGLGVGGLAFALAGKETLANLFGSVTIFADRPFQLGDRIRVGGKEGTIEEVGFRSTRIRTLDGHLVTIPNAIVANETIENITKRPFIKRSMEVTVTYDTPHEKLQLAIEIIQEMLEARKQHFPHNKPPRVHFTDFAAISLNIGVTYWFAPPDWGEYLNFNHDFNMELLQRFNAEGIEFAFPTQTLYLRRDTPSAAPIALARREGS